MVPTTIRSGQNKDANIASETEMELNENTIERSNRSAQKGNDIQKRDIPKTGPIVLRIPPGAAAGIKRTTERIRPVNTKSTMATEQEMETTEAGSNRQAENQRIGRDDDDTESTESSSSSDEELTTRNVKRLKMKLKKQTKMADVLAKGIGASVDRIRDIKFENKKLSEMAENLNARITRANSAGVDAACGPSTPMRNDLSWIQPEGETGTEEEGRWTSDSREIAVQTEMGASSTLRHAQKLSGESEKLRSG